MFQLRTRNAFRVGERKATWIDPKASKAMSGRTEKVSCLSQTGFSRVVFTHLPAQAEPELGFRSCHYHGGGPGTPDDDKTQL